MRAVALVGAVLMVIVAAKVEAAIINTSRSNIKKPSAYTSGVANPSGPSNTQTIYTTPGPGDFLLTQFCTSRVAGGIRLDVAGLGTIAETGVTESCVTFTPGIVVPEGTAISCSTTASAPAGTFFCMINGNQFK